MIDPFEDKEVTANLDREALMVCIESIDFTAFTDAQLGRLTKALENALDDAESEYLRRAAAAHLRLEEPRPKTFVSALEKMGDLVGIHKNGPRDLATNPKYMEGFGED